MGSADDALPAGVSRTLREKAEQLGRAIAGKDAVLLTGATTGLVHLVAQSAHEADAFHIGISPASSEGEHAEKYDLPTDACDANQNASTFGCANEACAMVASTKHQVPSVAPSVGA